MLPPGGMRGGRVWRERSEACVARSAVRVLTVYERASGSARVAGRARACIRPCSPAPVSLAPVLLANVSWANRVWANVLWANMSWANVSWANVLSPCVVGPCVVGPCVVGQCVVSQCGVGQCFVSPHVSWAPVLWALVPWAHLLWAPAWSAPVPLWAPVLRPSSRMRVRAVAAHRIGWRDAELRQVRGRGAVRNAWRRGGPGDAQLLFHSRAWRAARML